MIRLYILEAKYNLCCEDAMIIEIDIKQVEYVLRGRPIEDNRH